MSTKIAYGGQQPGYPPSSASITKNGLLCEIQLKQKSRHNLGAVLESEHIGKRIACSESILRKTTILAVRLGQNLLRDYCKQGISRLSKIALSVEMQSSTVPSERGRQCAGSDGFNLIIPSNSF